MDMLTSIADFIVNTGVPEQIRSGDAKGLFTNPWFLAPFISFIAYNLYKQAVNVLVITALAVALWLFAGSPMMENLVVGGEIQLGKVLVVVGVGVVAVGIAVYFLFMRSD